MDCLYHLVPLAAWEACKAASKPYYPPTYDADGFIHLTKAAELLLPVANHFYTDVPGTYIVLQIDAAKLSAEVKFEAAAPVGNTESYGATDSKAAILFPHLYGTIDYDAVAKELPVERDASGAFLSISGLC